MKTRLSLKKQISENFYYKLNQVPFIDLLELVQNNANSYFTLLRSRRSYLSVDKTSKRYHDLLLWINESLPLLQSEKYQLKTKCYWILNGLTEFPRCKSCKKLLKDANVTSISLGYHSFCSCQCSNENNEVKLVKEDTKLKRYGDKHYVNPSKISLSLKNRSTKEKQKSWNLSKKTRIRKYGIKNLTNSIKAKATKDSYKEKDPLWQLKVNRKISCTKQDKAKEDPLYVKRSIDKQIAYNLKHKGIALTNGKFKEVRVKISTTISINKKKDPLYIEKKIVKSKATKLKNHGNEIFVNLIKASNTYFKKAGYHWPSQDPSVRAKYDFESINAKISETKRKNKTFNSSKPEDEAFLILRFIFPKLERQYKSDEYPFHADFYDPNQLNMRFEFQGSWTHGKHPFNENSKQDLLNVMTMLAKGTKYYLNAVLAWLVRDPLKREVAKKNGITLIEFWNLDEVRDYVIHYFDKK